jgi:outer membrane protein OmpA-like peptidoglycan-associated protein
MSRFAGVGLLVLFACACHRESVQPPAPPQLREMVALLPDPENNTVGHAIVSSLQGGTVELTDQRTTTRIVNGQTPSAPFTLTEDEVQRLFGDALAARPLAPRHFLLYFQSGSDQLTPESEQLLPEILEHVKSRSVPDVTVTGHTDTTGSAQSNIVLGLSRASAIRDRLVAAGLDLSLVSMDSHGETNLLVPTPDETPEPRNRRVEVSVR